MNYYNFASQKLHYPSKHEELCDSMKKYGQAAGTHTAEVLARAIALREGRTKIRLKVELSRQEACDRVRGAFCAFSRS